MCVYTYIHMYIYAANLVSNIRTALGRLALVFLEDVCVVVAVEQFIPLAHLYCFQARLFQHHYEAVSTVRGGVGREARRERRVRVSKRLREEEGGGRE